MTKYVVIIIYIILIRHGPDKVVMVVDVMVESYEVESYVEKHKSDTISQVQDVIQDEIQDIILIYDERKLQLLLRSGIEYNPGPDSDDDWTPKKIKPLPVPRVKQKSKISSDNERQARSQDKQKQGISCKDQDPYFVCECGKRLVK